MTFGVGEAHLLSRLVSIINGLELNTFKQYDYLVQQLQYIVVQLVTGQPTVVVSVSSF